MRTHPSIHTAVVSEEQTLDQTYVYLSDEDKLLLILLSEFANVSS